MNYWIDCKKLKPPKGSRVLVLLGKGEDDIDIGIFLGWQKFRVDADRTTYCGVSHWMPLPKPFQITDSKQAITVNNLQS